VSLIIVGWLFGKAAHVYDLIARLNRVRLYSAVGIFVVTAGDLWLLLLLAGWLDAGPATRVNLPPAAWPAAVPFAAVRPSARPRWRQAAKRLAAASRVHDIQISLDPRLGSWGQGIQINQPPTNRQPQTNQADQSAFHTCKVSW